MTHLEIIQNNALGDTEEVSSAIIQKLYELATSGNLDASSDLKGRLHVTAGYRTPIEYLNQLYSDLTISADTYIIPFEDANMVTYLNSIGVGSNGVVTEADAAAATIVANSLNTTVTKFNELRYFTSITLSRGGISGNSDGWVRFTLWTALEEVDISNFTSIGHASDSGGGDTFNGCSSLKKVIASNKLETIGRNAFYANSNLETISGLDGVITFYKQAFKWCGKLKGSNFNNVEALFISGEHSVFDSCTALTSITLSSLNTVIPQRCFYGCSNLTTINLSNVTSIGSEAFYNSGITGNLILSNLTSLGGAAFRGSHLTSIDFTGSTFTTVEGDLFSMCINQLDHVIFPSTVTSVKRDCFYNCQHLSYIVFPTTSTITWEDGRSYFTNVSSNCIIYVADSKVSEVTTALSGKFNGQIKGISEMPSA